MSNRSRREKFAMAFVHGSILLLFFVTAFLTWYLFEHVSHGHYVC